MERRELIKKLTEEIKAEEAKIKVKLERDGEWSNIVHSQKLGTGNGFWGVPDATVKEFNTKWRHTQYSQPSYYRCYHWNILVGLGVTSRSMGPAFGYVTGLHIALAHLRGKIHVCKVRVPKFTPGTLGDFGLQEDEVIVVTPDMHAKFAEHVITKLIEQDAKEKKAAAVKAIEAAKIQSIDEMAQSLFNRGLLQ
jgi:hypothetical protein